MNLLKIYKIEEQGGNYDLGKTLKNIETEGHVADIYLSRED